MLSGNRPVASMPWLMLRNKRQFQDHLDDLMPFWRHLLALLVLMDAWSYKTQEHPKISAIITIK